MCHLLHSRNFIIEQHIKLYSRCDYFLKIDVFVTVKKKKEREEDRGENAEGKQSNMQIKGKGE